MPALVILRDAALLVETVKLPMVAVDVVQIAIILEIAAQMSAALEVSTDYDRINDAMDWYPWPLPTFYSQMSKTY